MTMKWLMTVQEVGTPSLALAHWPPGVGVEFNLMPLRLAADPDIGNEPVPNPNCFDTVKRWPKVVEVRRPDGPG